MGLGDSKITNFYTHKGTVRRHIAGRFLFMIRINFRPARAESAYLIKNEIAITYPPASKWNLTNLVQPGLPKAQ